MTEGKDRPRIAMTDLSDYLTTVQVAELLGVKPNTVHGYRAARRAGYFPEPDLEELGHPLWLPTTIEAFRNSRTRPRA